VKWRRGAIGKNQQKWERDTQSLFTEGLSVNQRGVTFHDDGRRRSGLGRRDSNVRAKSLFNRVAGPYKPGKRRIKELAKKVLWFNKRMGGKNTRVNNRRNAETLHTAALGYWRTGKTSSFIDARVQRELLISEHAYMACGGCITHPPQTHPPPHNTNQKEKE